VVEIFVLFAPLRGYTRPVSGAQIESTPFEQHEAAAQDSSHLPWFTNSNTILVFTCLSLSGCKLATNESRPLHNGYNIVAHYQGQVHRSARSELTYTDSGGKAKSVWPMVNRVIINGTTTVFTCWVHTERATERRLFAFEPSGPPLDITYEAILLRARERGGDTAELVEKASPGILREVEGGVQLGVGSVVWEPNHINFTWDEIHGFIHQIQSRGRLQKDGYYKTPYLTASQE
jgi:hypothetical protein